MQTRTTNYRYIILAVLIVAVVSLAGWAFAFYYDNPKTVAIAQKKAQNDNQTVNQKPLELDHGKLTLLLVCTGLIGFFGVRRQSNSLKSSGRGKHPKTKLRINFLNDRNLDKRACHIWEPDCVAS